MLTICDRRVVPVTLDYGRRLERKRSHFVLVNPVLTSRNFADILIDPPEQEAVLVRFEPPGGALKGEDVVGALRLAGLRGGTAGELADVSISNPPRIRKPKGTLDGCLPLAAVGIRGYLPDTPGCWAAYLTGGRRGRRMDFMDYSLLNLKFWFLAFRTSPPRAAEDAT